MSSTTTTQDIEVIRTSGAGWAINGNARKGSTLVQFFGPADDRKPGQRYEITGDPITTGYRSYFAQVTELGGHHDGNTFGMHYSLRA